MSELKVGARMKVTMLLADFAEAVNGKLYIMGGGWSVTGPQPCPSAIAVKLEVPWNEANRRHEIAIELLDGDYRPVLVPTPAGEKPVEIRSHFEVGRPAGIKAGSALDLPAAFNFSPLPLPPDRRYVWRLSIDGKTEEDWQVTFSTRPAPPAQPRQA